MTIIDESDTDFRLALGDWVSIVVECFVWCGVVYIEKYVISTLNCILNGLLL